MQGIFGTYFAMLLFANPQITVYQENLGLVQESRSWHLQKGSQVLTLEDLPKQIDPTSLHLDIPGVQVLAQRIQAHPFTLQSLYDRAVRRALILHLRSGQTLEATFLATSGDGLILETPQGVSYLPMDRIDRIDFPGFSAPETLQTVYQWTLEAPRTGAYAGTLTYLTQGLSWQATYRAVWLGDSLDLTGWVTVENRSGKTYPDARLQLVAGAIHRVSATPPSPLLLEQRKALAPTPSPQPRFEYHVYPFPRPVTLRDGEQQRLLFIPSHRFPARKVYVYEGDERVQVKIEFENTKETGLGIPLPSGVVRVYEQSDAQPMLFIGEDRISHVSEGATVRLYVGDAFDLKGEAKVVRSQKIRERVREEEHEVRLRNSKDTPVSVTVVQRFYGDWEIISSTVPYQKRDAYTVEFTPTVPAHGETTLRFTVRFYW